LGKNLWGELIDCAYAIQETIDGGYIVGGFTDTLDIKAYWILKLDKNGDIEWQKLFGSTSWDYVER
jgi:hypothetical protein